MSTKLSVLVTGVTGKQGGAVARALLEQGHRVAGLTRHPHGEAAYKLKELGVEPVDGDFNQPATLKLACRDMDAVFAMSTFFEQGVAAETEQGIALARAARESGVKHFVYTSVGSSDLQTGLPHFESKFAVEQAVRGLDLPYTFVRPVFFMENLLFPQNVEALKQGQYAAPLPASRKLQQVAVADIGRFAALAIDRRDEFVGRAYDIASEELTGREQAEVLSRVLGRTIRYVELPIEAYREQNKEMAATYEWFNRVGYRAPVGELRRRYPQVGWHSYEDWAKQQDWSALG